MRGVGCDIIEIERVEGVIARQGQSFLDKMFTPAEQAYCQSFNHSTAHFAGRFAAKEAIAKALGCGFGTQLNFLDIEILPSKHGTPLVTLSPTAQQLHNSPTLLLSISHDKHSAIAFALAT